MNNLYKEAMDEINISDQCLRKVKSMNNNNKKIKLTMIQRLRLKNMRKIWTKTILKLIPIQAKMVMLK